MGTAAERREELKAVWQQASTQGATDERGLEIDPAKRSALYHEFQKRIVEASPLVFVFELDFVTVYNKRLKDFLVSPLGLYSSFDQAWLAK